MPVKAAKTILVTTASGTAISSSTGWVPLSLHDDEFSVSFAVVKDTTGDITFKVEHTYDDVFDPDVTPTVFTHSEVTAGTANVEGTYDFPVRAVRLTTVSASGSSGVTFTVLQAGM